MTMPSPPLNILLIEDSEDDAFLVMRNLQKGGLAITSHRVFTLVELDRALREGHWDVVISDYSLPEFNGLDALDHVKQTGLDIPFILISGAIGEEVAVSAMKQGAHDFLLKENLYRLVPAIERELRETEVRRDQKRAEAALRESEERYRRAHAELEKSHRLLQMYTRKLEESNRDLEQFATIASHDLQAPLRKIQFFGEQLKAIVGEDPESDGVDTINRMQRAINRMQGLIRDLLSLSRINRKGEVFRKTDLNQVVQETLEILADVITESQGQIEVGLLPVIDADAVQMRQVFQNLIENALKFHRPGEAPQVWIRGGRTEDGFAQISVKDNGIGFKEEHQRRIFQAFQRLHGESEYPGTGIGLAIVQKIIDRHGGTIAAQSELGSGAVFEIQLPLHQQDSLSSGEELSEELPVITGI